ncbi:MAG: efflux RND transporter periplasmic adaptor subunit [Gammaproteobacteria bacterium]
MAKIKGFKQLLVLLVLTGVTATLWFSRPEVELELRALTPVSVSVGQPQRVKLQPTEKVSGYLRPARKVALPFEVSGHVVARHVEPGQSVKQGDILLELADGDFQDAVIQAKASVSEIRDSQTRDKRLLELARESRELQENEITRLNSLMERSLVSPSNLGDAKSLLAIRLAEEARLQSSVNIAPQRLSAKQAALDSARRNLARTQLKAPFDGRVNAVQADVGDYAGATQQAIELIDNQLDFFAHVRGEVARSLKLQAAVTVNVGGVLHEASILAVQPDPDPTTFTHEVRLRLPVEEVRSGISAEAVLPLQVQTSVLVVPVTAVIQEEGNAFVFQIVQDKLQRTIVTLGDRSGQQQVVLQGLTEGQTIVIRDVASLADGQKVIVVEGG